MPISEISSMSKQPNRELQGGELSRARFAQLWSLLWYVLVVEFSINRASNKRTQCFALVKCISPLLFLTRWNTDVELDLVVSPVSRASGYAEL